MKNSRLFHGLPAVLTVLVFGAWLFSRAYLPGSDGYYFLDQAVGILNSGSLRIKNHDPTPYFIAGLIRLGIQPELSVKLLFLAATGMWFWLGRKAETALFYLLAPLFLFHLIQFPKLTLALLLAIQAFQSLGWGSRITWLSGATLFHPIGLASWALAKLRDVKPWAPWIGSAALAAGFVVFGWFLRSQSFSLTPVGVKFLVNPHLPILFRICCGLWMGRMLFAPRQGWLVLGLLAPSSSGELFGSLERWDLALILFSPWLLSREKWNFFWAPLAPVAAGWMLLPMPVYDYSVLDQVIDLSKNLDMKMLVVDQTGKFYFTAKTGIDAYFFEPEDGWPKETTWRLARNVSSGELLPYLEGPCAPGSKTWFTLRPGTLLIREDCWEEIRSKILPGENEDLYGRIWDNQSNPSHKRPPFLDIRH